MKGRESTPPPHSPATEARTGSKCKEDNLKQGELLLNGVSDRYGYRQRIASLLECHRICRAITTNMQRLEFCSRTVEQLCYACILLCCAWLRVTRMHILFWRLSSGGIIPELNFPPLTEVLKYYSTRLAILS